MPNVLFPYSQLVLIKRGEKNTKDLGQKDTQISTQKGDLGGPHLSLRGSDNTSVYSGEAVA